MFPVTAQVPPAWVYPAILEELAMAMSDLEAVGMSIQLLREEGRSIEPAEAAQLWAFVEESRSFLEELRGRVDELARHLVDSFLTPGGWPLTAEEDSLFREALAARLSARAEYERAMAGERA